MYGIVACDFRRDDLIARKSWFFFDDEYVCLGAGIRNGTPYPVYTTVNQCHLKSTVEINSDGDITKLNRGARVITCPGWVHQDSILYVFPEKCDVNVRADVQEGSWYSINHALSRDTLDSDVFSLWFDHGVGPADASYAYIVRPGVSSGEAASYCELLPVRIVANDPTIQAVWHETLKTGGAAFYEPGEVAYPGGLVCSVDIPCIILLRETSGELEISVANPMNRAATVTVGIDRVCTGTGVAAGRRSGWSQVAIELPGGLDAGSTVTRTVALR